MTNWRRNDRNRDAYGMLLVLLAMAVLATGVTVAGALFVTWSGVGSSGVPTLR